MESELLGPIKITVTHFWNMHCLNIIIQAFTKTRYVEGNWGTLRAVLLKQQDSLFQQNVTLSEPTAIHCMSCNVDSAAINYSHRQARVTQAYFAYLPQMYCSRRTNTTSVTIMCSWCVPWSFSNNHCIGGESNPGLPRGRREFCHWTTNAHGKRVPSMRLYQSSCRAVFRMWEK